MPAGLSRFLSFFKSRMALHKVKPTTADTSPPASGDVPLIMPEKTIDRLFDAHTANHTMLEKALLGIPAVAVACAGALLKTTPADETPLFLLTSFGLLMVAFFSSLCSYFVASMYIEDFLVKKNKTRGQFTTFNYELRTGVRRYNYLSFTLTIFGLAALFLAITTDRMTMTDEKKPVSIPNVPSQPAPKKPLHESNGERWNSTGDSIKKAAPFMDVDNNSPPPKPAAPSKPKDSK